MLIDNLQNVIMLIAIMLIVIMENVIMLIIILLIVIMLLHMIIKPFDVINKTFSSAAK